MNQEQLQLRALILTKIRAFFAERKVLEVETPLLCPATNPCANLQNFTTELQLPGGKPSTTLYLQTSPELAMKKLLAAGSGDIYQICKAFRNGEIGEFHFPEFTMLEWYRIGFDHHDLMDETDALLKFTINTQPAERISYAEIFDEYLKIDPHQASVAELKSCAVKHGIDTIDNIDDRDTWLQLLMSLIIEPKIGRERPIFIKDFPASQAMLAQISPTNPQVAERFEVYFHGLELANGFHELNDPEEQRRRFMSDLAERKKLNLPPIPIDEEFLAILPKLPNCAGIALGIDRLSILLGNANIT